VSEIDETAAREQKAALPVLLIPTLATLLREPLIHALEGVLADGEGV
jgi:hypothetical protein